MGEPVLRAHSVHFSYFSGKAILDDWSASFDAGTTTALVGRSGRGKSTALYLLGLMLRATGGSISVHGRSTRNVPDRELSQLRANHFGFLFQDAALDASRSVLDNVIEPSLYVPAERREVVRNARSLLDQFGVEVPANRTPGQVSGGQAQRIALCRALVMDPQIVLADEPTGNLDPHSGALVLDGLLARARQGAAVVIVTHSPDVAGACDRIIEL